MILEKKENSGPLVLLLLDGWGIAAAGEGNAISRAQTPFFKELTAKYPATVLLPSHLAIAKKKINIAGNYLSIGTGKKKALKNDASFFEYFASAGKRWLAIVDPEKLAYGAFFINNKKKLKSDNLAVITDASGADSAEALAAELLKKIKSRKFDFILAIFSAIDLAAHNGNFSAAMTAAETADQALGKLVKTVLDNSGVLLISSSHGNAEDLIDMQTELQNKKDTDNPVPLVIVGRQFEGKSFGFPEAPNGDLSIVPPSGSLLDIAPTILKIMGIDFAPENFDGKPLI
jgi:bisphosphoglycerate-independent phosphoglycerate mutase (AlkP superfamily)